MAGLRLPEAWGNLPRVLRSCGVARDVPAAGFHRRRFSSTNALGPKTRLRWLGVAAHATGGAVWGFPPVSKEFSRGTWHREVVQRGEGFRVHFAGGRRGRVRALLGHPGRRIQDTRRG